MADEVKPALAVTSPVAGALGAGVAPAGVAPAEVAPAGLAVSGLADAVRALASVDVHATSDAALVAGLEQLLVCESQLRAVQAAWLATAETRDATVAECGRAARSWLVEDCQLGPAEASRRMRLARRLGSAPLLAAVFAAGEVTAEHATTILNALPAVPEEVRAVVEEALVGLARTQPPHLVARAVDEILARLGVVPSAEEAYARRYGERGVDLAETFAGFGSLSGTLTPEAQELVRLAVKAASASTGPEDERTARQRRHDGLVEIASFYLHHGELAQDGGERPRVIVTIPLEVLHAQGGVAGGVLDSGLPLAPDAARRIACDAELIPAVLGSRGEPLDLGRATRIFSVAIRRAARLRDGSRCAFPSCGRPIVDLHHMVWWSAGGATSLDNAAWLCSFHHWLVHEGHWQMRRNPDGSYTFTSPDQREHSGVPPGVQSDDRQPEAA